MTEPTTATDGDKPAAATAHPPAEPQVRAWLRKLEEKFGGPRRPASTGAEAAADTPSTSQDDTQPPGVRALIMSMLGQRIGMLLALSLCINVLTLAVPVFVLQVYDRVVQHAGYETLVGLCVMVVLALVFDYVFRQARGRMFQLVAMRLDVVISRRLFAKLTAMPLRALERMSQAQWRLVLRDGETVRDTVAGPATSLLLDVPFVILFLVVIWTIASPVAWVLLAIMPVFIGLAVASQVLIDKSSAVEQEAATNRDALVDQMVSGRTTVKALGLASALRGRWEQLQASLMLQSVRRGGRVDTFSHLATQMAMLTTVLMTSFGAIAIINHDLTIGGLIAANMLAARVVQPLTRAVGVWRGISRFRRSAARVDALLAQPDEAVQSHIAHAAPRGALRLENVTFHYDGEQRAVLDGISLALARGMTGIVGRNGTGKTTMLKVLQGLYRPDNGRVLLDGADMTQYGRDDLARWIGYVPQELFFIDGTIRDNIAKGRDDVDDAAIVRAVETAGAQGFIAKLPDGFGTKVGEGAARFSIGERQLMAIARALVDDPPVLLLDEPTAHLDPTAVDVLTRRLVDLSRKRTVVVISHDRALLQCCSTLVAMDAGRVAFSGPAPEVLARLAGQARPKNAVIPGKPAAA